MTQTNQIQPATVPWGKPFRVAGTILLLLSPLLALFLVRPYWSNLIVAAILALLLRPVVGLFQNRLHLNRPVSITLTLKYVKERLEQSPSAPAQTEEASN